MHKATFLIRRNFACSPMERLIDFSEEIKDKKAMLGKPFSKTERH